MVEFELFGIVNCVRVKNESNGSVLQGLKKLVFC